MSKRRPNIKNDAGVVGRSVADAIRRIALQGMVDPDSGDLLAARRINGYVAKINDDGTIDVQEYLDEIENDEGIKIGYHEGVYLSSLQSNPNGYLIVPKMYSEVVIVKDPVTKVEYVSMFSHVDVLQLESSDTVTVGVVEREELDLDDENSPDVDELEPTGLSGKTTYSKDEVKTEVADEEGEKTSSIDVKSGSVDVSVSDSDESTLHMDKTKIEAERGKSKNTLEDDANTMQHDSTVVKISDGVVFLGSDSGTSHGVLGEELADVLSDILDYCSQIKTTTYYGPQPPLNMAQFIALKAKIAAWKSAVSQFLTQKVEVQK